MLRQTIFDNMSFLARRCASILCHRSIPQESSSDLRIKIIGRSLDSSALCASERDDILYFALQNRGMTTLFCSRNRGIAVRNGLNITLDGGCNA